MIRNSNHIYGRSYNGARAKTFDHKLVSFMKKIKKLSGHTKELIFQCQ